VRTPKPDRKTVCTTLLEHFGTCKCTNSCAREQYVEEEAGEHKPGGRYSVCEIEAEKLGIWTPPEEEADDAA
jgi:hypothetical protein